MVPLFGVTLPMSSYRQRSLHNITHLLGCICGTMYHMGICLLQSTIPLFVRSHTCCVLWIFLPTFVDYHSFLVVVSFFKSRPLCSYLIMLCRTTYYKDLIDLVMICTRDICIWEYLWNISHKKKTCLRIGLWLIYISTELDLTKSTSWKLIPMSIHQEIATHMLHFMGFYVGWTRDMLLCNKICTVFSQKLVVES